jgi:hypothetical protein
MSKDNGIRNRVRRASVTTGQCECGDITVLVNGKCRECNGVKDRPVSKPDYRQFGRLADRFAVSDPR